MRATLGEVLSEEAFAGMIPLAERWTTGVEAGIRESALPWQSPGSVVGPSTSSAPTDRGTGERRTLPETLRSSATCTSTP
jgi:hypothetical protein